MTILGQVVIDGDHLPVDRATIPVTDIALQRGYGCFETIRSYDGYPFRLARHLDRLSGSGRALGLSLPRRETIAGWVEDRAAEGDCSVRVLVTGGGDVTHPGIDSHVIVFAEALPHQPAALRLQPRPAPWHPDGEPSELTGAKTLSYAPNVAARLAAVAAGYDDALLIGEDDIVLEGPSSSIAWVRGDRLEHPSAGLGVLDGVTVAAVCEVAPSVGLTPAPGRFTLERLLEADEVVVMSTVREVAPVAAVGGRAFDLGPAVPALSAAFRDLARSERTRR